MTTSPKDDARVSKEPRKPDPTGSGDTAPNPREGLDREVGDLEDADAVEHDGALPGRAGGGLAGG